jgi:Zn-dependent alcohol dehydrogenase
MSRGLLRRRRIVGSIVGDVHPIEDLGRLLALAASGDFPVQDLVGDRQHDLDAAARLLSAGAAKAKDVIVPMALAGSLMKQRIGVVGARLEACGCR